MEGIFVVVALWAWSNADFLQTKNEQIAQGYKWVEIECRAPNKELPHIKMTTPIGNEYVCYKLVK